MIGVRSPPGSVIPDHRLNGVGVEEERYKHGPKQKLSPILAKFLDEFCACEHPSAGLAMHRSSMCFVKRLLHVCKSAPEDIVCKLAQACIGWLK